MAFECNICMTESSTRISFCPWTSHDLCPDCAQKMCAVGEHRCPFCRRVFNYNRVERFIDATKAPAYASEQPPPPPKKKAKPTIKKISAIISCRRLNFDDDEKNTTA